MKVMRCMRSFSASSSSVRIQPPLCSKRRSERRWSSMPPTIPGTAATVSSIIARQPYLL
uniref:Aox1 n=1 Tax=Arundo donax TaxID=35708 RepID=A0A0A9A0R0_ARUDO